MTHPPQLLGALSCTILAWLMVAWAFYVDAPPPVRIIVLSFAAIITAMLYGVWSRRQS